MIDKDLTYSLKSLENEDRQIFFGNQERLKEGEIF